MVSLNKEEEIKDNKKVKVSVDREFEEVEGGEYLDNGFYITPNGSFWDPDGVYFNREGHDRHEGYYDEEYEYHPGRGWIPHMMCYEDERSEGEDNGNDVNDLGDEGDDLDYDNIDDLHDDVDYGDLAEEKDKKSCIIEHKILTFKDRKKENKENKEEKNDKEEKEVK